MQPIPTNDNVLGYVIAGLFTLLSALIGLIVWLFKNELGRIRERIHELGNYINTVLLEAVKSIGKSRKDE